MAVPIEVVPYDPTWPDVFRDIAAVIDGAIGEHILRIEHVGSTSVLWLAAKPIIDIDVVIPTREILPAVIDGLATLGYMHNGNQGVSGREAFKLQWDTAVIPAPLRHPHYLYVCAADCAELTLHLAFRDYLRSHPDAAAEYAVLKLNLAVQFRDDRLAYNEGKTDMVRAITAKALAGTEYT